MKSKCKLMGLRLGAGRCLRYCKHASCIEKWVVCRKVLDYRISETFSLENRVHRRRGWIRTTRCKGDVMHHHETKERIRSVAHRGPFPGRRDHIPGQWYSDSSKPCQGRFWKWGGTIRRRRSRYAGGPIASADNRDSTCS